jgi:hypothetical protein
MQSSHRLRPAMALVRALSSPTASGDGAGVHLDGIPGTRVTGHPCPGTLVPGHFFIFLFLFFWRELIFLGKKMEKNCVFSLFFLSFSLYFSLSLYTQFGFFLV